MKVLIIINNIKEINTIRRKEVEEMKKSKFDPSKP